MTHYYVILCHVCRVKNGRGYGRWRVVWLVMNPVVRGHRWLRTVTCAQCVCLLATSHDIWYALLLITWLSIGYRDTQARIWKAWVTNCLSHLYYSVMPGSESSSHKECKHPKCLGNYSNSLQKNYAKPLHITSLTTHFAQPVLRAKLSLNKMFLSEAFHTAAPTVT